MSIDALYNYSNSYVVKRREEVQTVPPFSMLLPPNRGLCVLKQGSSSNLEKFFSIVTNFVILLPRLFQSICFLFQFDAFDLLADFGSASLKAPANSFVGTPYW